MSEKDLITESLVDKFRLLLENIETVKRLNVSLEQTQQQVDFISERLENQQKIHLSTKSTETLLQQLKFSTNVAPSRYPDDPIRKQLYFY